MYGVEEHLWIGVAEMHLDGPAGRWFQSIESQLSGSWSTFYKLLHDRFDGDQHELLLRQLFNIRHTSTVTDYVDRFTEIVEQLSAYSTNRDPLFFTMRFIDGLRSDIKSVVLVQRPKTFDTAASLALLQEEAGVPWQPKHGRAGDWSGSARSTPATKQLLPLPPPPRHDQPSTTAPVQAESKLAALKGHRKALGLCYKCGAKWSRDHKCPPEILNAVEAIWETLESEDSHNTQPEVSHSEEQLFLAISKAAVLGTPASRTVRFAGSIQGVPVVILLDSGSSASFLSQWLLACLMSLPCRLSVRCRLLVAVFCRVRICSVRFNGLLVLAPSVQISEFFLSQLTMS